MPLLQLNLFPVLLILAVFFVACNDSTETTKEKKETRVIVEPESELTEDCQFSMQMIKASPDKRYKAVVGTKNCENSDQPTSIEVTIYKKEETINGKPSNVFKVNTELVNIEIKWAGETLTITHNAQPADILLKEDLVYGHIKVTYNPHS